MKASEYKISKEKFVFHTLDDKFHEKKLDTKPISYLKDAFIRFKRNKASIVAAIIICILFLFAIFAPIFSKYTVAYKDSYYAYATPRNNLFVKLGIPFWDGYREKIANELSFNYLRGIEIETGRNVIYKGQYETIKEKNILTNKEEVKYKLRYNTINSVGVIYMIVTPEDYQKIQDYQDRKGVQIIYPIVDLDKRPQAQQDNNDGNFWYETKKEGSKTKIVLDKDGNLKPVYKPYTGNDNYTSKMRIEGDTPLYDYAFRKGASWEIRVDYYEYYKYYHAEIAKDGITEPSFIFGTTSYGQDIFTCLASGARFSFILAIIVSSVNLFVGAIYGSIEGYYGGKVDLTMERVSDILGSIPFMVVITILKYHMEGTSHLLILFLSFFATGWIGMASRTRMQFYRFKNQEYVLAARTLGAKDSRIMFKHIFPNALGTLITGSVLVIPSTIFSETTLSYLGIIDLTTGNLTSVGTLLAKAQPYLQSYPYMILFPSIFISLLMLCFNLFGNGLRDAFNPSLRGTED